MDILHSRDVCSIRVTSESAANLFRYHLLRLGQERTVNCIEILSHS